MKTLKILAALVLLSPLVACEELTTALEDATAECDDHVEVLYDVYFSISFADPDDHYRVSYRDENGDMVTVDNIRTTSWLWSDPYFEPGSNQTLQVFAPCGAGSCLTGTTRLIMEILVDGEVAAKEEISELEDGSIPFTIVQSVSNNADDCPS